MGVALSGNYLGGKKIELLHEESGARIVTDAPKDNNGEGTSFSPTDLASASLGACMMTMIAIVAERHQLDLTGMKMRVEKNMAANPRRIASLPLVLTLPASLPAQKRELLEKTALACPVKHSLHPEVELQVTFEYK